MPRKSQFSLEQQDEIVELYLNGESTVKIAKRFESKAPTIASLLKKKIGNLRSNKENSRKYFYDKTYFEEIDTPEKAYWLGFIYADGYVQHKKDGSKLFGMSLSVVDKKHLERLRDCLSSTYPVKTYEASESSFGTKRYSRLQIFGEEIFNNLVKHGVVPNKTLVVSPPCVDDILVRHFIRGYFDGDGCLTSSNRVHGKDYAVKIVGTKLLLDFIRDFIESNGIATIHKYHKRRDADIVYGLELAGNIQVKNFLDMLYEGSTIHLDRKYDRYMSLSTMLHSRASRKRKA